MLILLLLLSLTSPTLCRKDYTGYTLILLLLKEGDNFDSLRKILDDDKIDVWNLPSIVYGQASFLIPPNLVDQVENELISNNIQYEIRTRNLQKWIDKEYEENPPDNKSDGEKEDFSLDNYHTLEAINSHLDYLHSLHPTRTQVITVGETFEGNSLKILKVGKPDLWGDKPAIWIHSGIHAREWLSPATSLYIIHKLLEKTPNNTDIQQLILALDWYFLPVANPDGYNYTWFNDRLWRKNRAPTTSNTSCIGTDLNRNFDVGFGDSTGANGDPCSENYHGSAAFSENETQTIRYVIYGIELLQAVITIHGSGQQLMSPYGYTKDYPPDYEDQLGALRAMQSAIEEVHEAPYTVGRIVDFRNFVTGSSTDWAYEELNIKYSFALEGRDRGRRGALLPKQEIISSAREIFAAVTALGKQIMIEQYTG